MMTHERTFGRSKRTTLLSGLVVAAMLTAAPPSRAQDVAAQEQPNRSSWSSPNPGLSGFWEPRDAAGSGSFEAVFKVPKAQLEAGQTPPRRPVAADYAYGAKPPVDGTACSILAFPFYQTSSPPWEILQTRDEVLIVTEREMGSRHIYMDGRSHPAHLTPTSNGDSIGHWEGTTLVVDTVGFRSGGAGVPGGGLRGPNTHLLERYDVVNDPKNGTELRVNLKWDDPGIYARPHEYSLTYYKMPKDTYALEDWCDAGDPAEYMSANGVIVIGKDSIYNKPQGSQQQGGTPPTQTPASGATPAPKR